MSVHRPPPAEGRSWTVGPDSADAPLLLAELAPSVPFGFVGRMLPTSERGELWLELAKIPTAEALESLHALETTARAEVESGSEVAGARGAQRRLDSEVTRELAERVAAREQELWRVGVAFHAIDRTAGDAQRLRSDLVRRLAGLGFRTRVPEFEARAVAERPGVGAADRRPDDYWHLLSTDGAAAFFPFVDEAIAEPGGALVGLLLEDAAPVILDRWSRASYSWGLFGTTGSGKTFAAALLAMRERWTTPDLSVTVVDPLGEFVGFARALGGEVVHVGPGGGGRINPLDPATTDGDVQEKSLRVGAMLRALFPTLGDHEAAYLDARVARLVGEGGPAVPTFARLADEVRADPAAPPRLAALLALFDTPRLRHVNGPSTVALGANPLVLSLADAAPEDLAFHLTYLLDAVYAELRRRSGPKLLVIDEAHRLAAHPATIDFLDRLIRHVRHFRAGLLVLSQSPDDFLATETGRSLLRNLRATLLLRLPEVSRGVRDFYGLTDAEVEWLPRARLPAEVGYAEALLREGSSHLPIAVVASEPEFEFLSRALRDAADRPASGLPRPGEPPGAAAGPTG